MPTASSDLALNTARGWSAVVATCEADPGCAQAFPDLADRLNGFVANLAANPRRFDEVQLDGPDCAPFLLTASRLLSYIRFYGQHIPRDDAEHRRATRRLGRHPADVRSR